MVLSSSFTFLICLIASATFPVPGSPFVLIIEAPSSILLKASANDLAPLTTGVVKSHFQICRSSSAGVKTSDSSIISTSVSCKTSASLTCPILHLAITGMVTESIISSIILILAVRATPPAFLTSDGSLSKTITETAPASSAICACSTVVTSITTPFFNI